MPSYTPETHTAVRSDYMIRLAHAMSAATLSEVGDNDRDDAEEARRISAHPDDWVMNLIQEPDATRVEARSPDMYLLLLQQATRVRASYLEESYNPAAYEQSDRDIFRLLLAQMHTVLRYGNEHTRVNLAVRYTKQTNGDIVLTPSCVVRGLIRRIHYTAAAAQQIEPFTDLLDSNSALIRSMGYNPANTADILRLAEATRPIPLDWAPTYIHTQQRLFNFLDRSLGAPPDLPDLRG